MHDHRDRRVQTLEAAAAGSGMLLHCDGEAAMNSATRRFVLLGSSKRLYHHLPVPAFQFLRQTLIVPECFPQLVRAAKIGGELL
jgi:hypothetical protein